MRKNILFLALGLTLIMSAPALAKTISVSDSAINWPGYDQTKTNASYRTSDVIGIPNILEMDFTFTGSTLTSIGVDFNLKNTAGITDWNTMRIKPGDIFIDTDADAKWNYIIHNPTNLIYSDYATISGAPVASTWTIYSTSLDYSPSSIADTSLYNMSTVFVGNPNSYIWRKDHPIQASSTAISGATAIGTATVTWPQTAATTGISALWELASGLEFLHGQTITVGFTVSCANDVFFQDVRVPNPEPVTMLLMGAGFAGIAGFARRRRQQS